MSAPLVATLMGHPIRWEILTALSRSDRRVSELVDLTGASQNLVSYHLGLLREGHVISARRSSADARDVYYILDQRAVASQLADLQSTLHPALAPGGSKRAARGFVLFLCTANSARSQMAEALMRRTAGRTVRAVSAGSHPEPVHPLALRVLSERGVSTAGLRPKHWSEVTRTNLARVVTLCDMVREELPRELVTANHVHWSLADPAGVTGGSRRLAAFRDTADLIEVRVRGLIAELVAEAA